MTAEPSLGAGSRLSHYRLVSLLGAGGMGEVFLAEDLSLNRKVALKLLPRAAAVDDERRQRFVQEARAASALNHPHIVTVYEIGSDGGRDFIAMEHVDGQSLREALRRGRIATKQALEWVAQAAAAVAAAHSAGIVHRDIKPENLMVAGNGQLKVLDFGLAKLMRDSTAEEPNSTSGTAPLRLITEAGLLLGTVSYMSPEQAEGGLIDHRTDIFSLGIVLYELLTGKPPFEGRSAIERLQKIIAAEPRSPMDLNPTLPPAIVDVVARALAKDREQRYQHAGDFALDLRRLKEHPHSPSASESGRRRMPWRAGMIGGMVGMAAVSLLIFLGYRMWPRHAAEAIELKGVTLTPVTTDPGYEGEPTFSPDGQTIAYVSDRSGNLEIFLKQISGGPDINLTNSPADDVQPVFSPDGKQIAFVSSRASATALVFKNPTAPLMGGDIWVMPALGGPPRRVVRSGNFPSWSPDGATLVYTSGTWSRQKIFTVPAQGGTPREVPVKFESRHLFIFHPSYSRDGRWILFGAQNNLIYVVRSTGGTARRIASGRRPVWNADSTAILYSTAARDRNYSLWQVPFSPSRGEVTGDAQPLTIGRGHDTDPSPSRDGRYIAFAAQEVSFNLEKIPLDAEAGRITGTPAAVTSGNETIYYFDVSPTGESITYESNRGSGFHLWRVDEGMPPVQLTSDPLFDDRFAAWSPDGEMIAFHRQDIRPGGKGHVWIMGADGSNPQPLFETVPLFLTWSPIGRAIAHFSSTDGQIYLFDLDSRRSRALTREPGVRSFQSFSRDGKWLAYQVAGHEGTTDTHAIPVSGGAVVPAITTTHEDFHPIFSPSGRWLYVQFDHKNLYRVPGPMQGWRRADPVKVTDFPESNLYLDDPQFSPDGKTLFYSRGRMASDVWVMKIRE